MSPKRKKSKKREVLLVAVLLVAAVALASLGINLHVYHTSKGRCYESTDDMPYRRVGLLLGTTPYLKNGNMNLYFKYRIEACANLYHAGKISKVLVSGDNHRKDYNEPEEMRLALIAAGVPNSDIVLDYAGFRTYDSMVRAKKVFGQESVTVISQKWHNERAIYIAHHIGIDAIGYDAKDVVLRASKVRLAIREYLSRVKMAVDLLFEHDPHFLGEPIEI